MGSKKRNIEKGGIEKQKTNNKKTASQPSNGMMIWFIILSLVLPVIYTVSTFDPVISIRYLILCIFVVLFIIYYFILRKISFALVPAPLLKVLFFIALAFSIWNIVTMYTAINFKESFFETSRTVLNFIFLFLVMVAVDKDKNNLNALCKTLVIMAIFQSMAGILQYYDLGFTKLKGNYKPYGFMANRNLFGSAQALLFPFAIYLLAVGSKTWKYVSGVALAGLTISVLLSQTRSAWLSAAAIVILSLVLIIIFLPEYRKKWIIGTLSYAAATAAIVFVFIINDTEGKLAESLKERGATLSQSISDTPVETQAISTANERLVIWGKTQSLINDHKLLGVGPANWKVGIQAYGNKGLINEYGFYVLDHCHNIYLQIAAETGIPGLLLFLSFWILLAIIALLVIKKSSEQKDKILVSVLLAGITGFAIDGMFSFPLERIEHSFYLFLMGGIILGFYYSLYNNPKTKTVTGKWAFFPLALGIVILYIAKEEFVFDRHFYNIIVANRTAQYQDVISEAEEVRAPFSSLNETGNPVELYKAMAYKELKQYDKALVEINKARKQHPHNARVYNTLGTIYTETQNFTSAIDAYKKALEIAPKFDVVLKNLAINYYNTKEYAKCVEILNTLDITHEPILLQVKNASIQYLQLNKQQKK
jgi:O-antigen ligase